MGATLAAGRGALARLEVTLGLVDEVLRSDSPLQYRVVEMTEELTETARSIRTFVNLLERHPQAVLVPGGSLGGGGGRLGGVGHVTDGRDQ